MSPESDVTIPMEVARPSRRLVGGIGRKAAEPFELERDSRSEGEHRARIDEVKLEALDGLERVLAARKRRDWLVSVGDWQPALSVDWEVLVRVDEVLGGGDV